MAIIFCLLGKSASGKNTILSKLIKYELGLIPIICYTTRQKRINEIDGIDYHFVEKQKEIELTTQYKVIAYRKYHTLLGKYSYFFLDDNTVKRNTNNRYIVILGLKEYLMFQNYFYTPCLVPIYVHINFRHRVRRLFKRNQNRFQLEMIRRLIYDAFYYRKRSLTKAGINHVVKNKDIDSCILEIQNYITCFNACKR